MTKFTLGPAHGVTLMLKGTPVFLRVTEYGGKFDALDQPEDEPRPEETLYVYKLYCFQGRAFVDGKNCHGLYPICEFLFLEQQPPQALLRDRELWEAWCQDQSPGT